MSAERNCPLVEDGSLQEIPARCTPCVRSALRMNGSTVATQYYEYDQEEYPYYAERKVLEWLAANGERRRHITEYQVVNPDTEEVIVVEHRDYVSFKCPRS